MAPRILHQVLQCRLLWLIIRLKRFSLQQLEALKVGKLSG